MILQRNDFNLFPLFGAAHFSLWRNADICDMSFNHFEINDGTMIQPNPRISNFVFGIPTSQSSIEPVNHRTKVKFERRTLETCRLMELFTGFISDIVRKDYESE